MANRHSLSCPTFPQLDGVVKASTGYPAPVRAERHMVNGFLMPSQACNWLLRRCCWPVARAAHLRCPQEERVVIASGDTHFGGGSGCSFVSSKRCIAGFEAQNALRASAKGEGLAVRKLIIVSRNM